MNKRIVNLWADIGSDSYWKDVMEEGIHVFVPFESRWPQPGFIGHDYFDMPKKVVVMGQNPRASNTARATSADTEMFRLIRVLSKSRTNKSLAELFSMTWDFMRGIGYTPAWKPIIAAERHLGLNLEHIAYLNLIPLATYKDKIVPEFRKAFDLSTKRQLEVLAPTKIVVFGKGAHNKFNEVSGGKWDSRYIEQRNLKDAPSVRKWLNQ